MIRIAIVLLLAAVCASDAVAAGKVYRWVDENGKVHFGDAPPPSVDAAELKIRSFTGEAEIEAGNDAGGREVTMYTTSWCSVCRRARDYLHKRGIPFSEWDIERNPYARMEYNLLNGRGVPLILVGAQRMNGFSAGKLEKMLKKAGYGPADRKADR
jgi:glutaredoxin